MHFCQALPGRPAQSAGFVIVSRIFGRAKGVAGKQTWVDGPNLSMGTGCGRVSGSSHFSERLERGRQIQTARHSVITPCIATRLLGREPTCGDCSQGFSFFFFFLSIYVVATPLNLFVSHYEPLNYDQHNLIWNHNRVRRSNVGPKEIELRIDAFGR